MHVLTSAKTAAMVAALAAAGSLLTAPLASAAPGSLSTAMPMSSQWRACDFSKLKWVAAVGNGRPVAHVGTNGSGTMVATVDMATALPYTQYDVRVVQTPRATQGCAAGAPGVLTGSVQTDAVGGGTTTIAGPVAAGATGAWVIVERPSQYSQTPAEFYSTEFIASV